jgi:hypothetical protein
MQNTQVLPEFHFTLKIAVNNVIRLFFSESTNLKTIAPIICQLTVKSIDILSSILQLVVMFCYGATS